jgi:hypothetical protein
MCCVSHCVDFNLGVISCKTDNENIRKKLLLVPARLQVIN